MRYAQFLVFVALLFFPNEASAQEECAPGMTCVQDGDLADLLTLAEEMGCLKSTNPTFYTDSITITTDKEGRVYVSGANPYPFTMRMAWCGFTLTSEMALEVMVAKAEPDPQPASWGFRFRLKFAGSYLIVDAVRGKAEDGIEVGLLWDFFYWEHLNVNVATGFRSAGLGLGYDITKNFGAYGGYAFSFWALKSNPQFGLYFGFW